MSNIAIRAEGLSKRYQIGRSKTYKTIRESLVEGTAAAWQKLTTRRPNADTDDSERITDGRLWALRDVSFEVERGEVIGIIGRNGAGKSTLLKILSRITKPTSGFAEIHGRVGSLLEVGTGFHHELTGRENIYLNGIILGMRKREIDRKFDEIVAFSEIEQFLDTPVKRYSSGMYMRLAFAVAANMDPEILLVDEVLAVGDAAFQRKCLGKMGSVASEGRTIFFVSHNMAAIQSLCRRSIWLHDGAIVASGETGAVVSQYLQTSFTQLGEQNWPDMASAPGNDKVRIRRAAVVPEFGPASSPITVRTPFRLEFEYWNLVPDAELNLSLHIYNEQGIMVFNPLPVNEPQWNGKAFPVGLWRTVCHIPGDLMNDGMHRVELMVVQDDNVVNFKQDDMLVFDIRDAVELRSSWHGKWAGAVRPLLEWDTELLESGVEHDVAESP